MHGWVFVGVPVAGRAVTHPGHGTGVVARVTAAHVTARFADGERTFARNPGRGAKAGFARAPSAKGKLSDLMGETSRDVTAETAARVDGTFAGLTAHVEKAGAGPASVGFRGSVTDEHGTRVGTFQEVLHRRGDGALAAEKALLTLDPGVQGQGFASAFERHLDSVYRDAGADRVELHANIDVGGYAWARKGYDWASAGDADAILRRLAIFPRRHEWEDDGGMPASPQVRREVASILARAKSEPFGSARYPTPYEVSQVGYKPGEKTWPGKELLLGSSWHGVRYL